MSPHTRERIISFWHWLLDAGISRSKSRQAAIAQARHDARMTRMNRDAMRARRESKARARSIPAIDPVEMPGHLPALRQQFGDQPAVIVVQAPPRVQTIEKTSKFFKGQILIAILIMVFSVGGCTFCGVAGNPEAGASWGMLAIIAMVYYVGVKIAAWWNHG